MGDNSPEVIVWFPLCGPLLFLLKRGFGDAAGPGIINNQKKTLQELGPMPDNSEVRLRGFTSERSRKV